MINNFPVKKQDKLIMNFKMVKVKQNVAELSCKEFNEFIKCKFAVIDFFADWSMSCLMSSPIIEELSEKLREQQVKFARLNIEEGSKIADKLKIMSIPTIVIFKEGKAISRISGTLPLEILEERIRQYF